MGAQPRDRSSRGTGGAFAHLTFAHLTFAHLVVAVRLASWP
jgi:hypothetical protein